MKPRHRCQCCARLLPVHHYRLLVNGAVWHLCGSDYRAVMAGRVDD